MKISKMEVVRYSVEVIPLVMAALAGFILTWKGIGIWLIACGLGVYVLAIFVSALMFSFERTSAQMAERERCARVASSFSMKSSRSIHPDIPWDQMNGSSQMAAHTTAQQISMEIRRGK